MIPLFIFLSSVTSAPPSHGYSGDSGGIGVSKYIDTTKPFVPTRVVFLNAKLEFKANGDIIHKGKKLGSDKEIYKGLREALRGCKCQ